MARAVPEVYKNKVWFDITNKAYQSIVKLLHEQHEDNINITLVGTIKTSRRIHYLKEIGKKRQIIKRKRTFQEIISHKVNPLVMYDLFYL